MSTGVAMALREIFVKTLKFSGKVAAGDKYSDAGGLHVLVKEAEKYWRPNSCFTGKQEILALSVYPEVSLAQARQHRDRAKKLLVQEIAPGAAKREDRRAEQIATSNIFEAVTRDEKLTRCIPKSRRLV